MLNRKQRKILLIVLALLVVAGAIYFAVRNQTQGGGDSGTLAFSTPAAEDFSLNPAPNPGTSESAATEAEQEAETSVSEESEIPEETDSDLDPEAAGESITETEEETPAPTTEETTETPTSEETTAPAPETPAGTASPPDDSVTENGITVVPDGEYTDKDHVALYIHAFGKLPQNYISKQEAEDLGWVASKGNLWEVAPGKSIGGSHFGNYEKLLPTKKGRKYYECDIDYRGRGRGAKRIIYSNDGLIFYTADHYESFEQLY